jgi:hypothetical protein
MVESSLVIQLALQSLSAEQVLDFLDQLLEAMLATDTSIASSNKLEYRRRNRR